MELQSHSPVLPDVMSFCSVKMLRSPALSNKQPPPTDSNSHGQHSILCLGETLSFSTHHLLSLASTLPGDPVSDAFVGTGGLEKLLSFVWETSNPEILGETSHLCSPPAALSLVSILTASPSG